MNQDRSDIPDSDCTLCGGKDTELWFHKGGYPLFRCSGCGFIFVPEPVLDVSLSDYYQSGYYAGGEESKGYPAYANDERLIRRNFRKKLEYLERFKSPGSLLDVGAAYGYLLDEARKRGWETYGIDVSSHAGSFAQEKMGLQIKIGDFLNHDFGDCAFDAITMFDVIEHLREPVRCLRNTYDLLKPGGVLLVVTGNADCLWARLLGRRWYFYNPPQHLSAFSESNLCSTLRSCGFTDTEVETFGRRISLNNALFKLSTLSDNKIIKAMACSLRGNALANIGLYVRFGDEMVIAASKAGSREQTGSPAINTKPL